MCVSAHQGIVGGVIALHRTSAYTFFLGTINRCKWGKNRKVRARSFGWIKSGKVRINSGAPPPGRPPPGRSFSLFPGPPDGLCTTRCPTGLPGPLTTRGHIKGQKQVASTLVSSFCSAGTSSAQRRRRIAQLAPRFFSSPPPCVRHVKENRGCFERRAVRGAGGGGQRITFFWGVQIPDTARLRPARERRPSLPYPP